MRRVLFLTITLVLLLGTFGTASAQDVGDYHVIALGDIGEFNVWTATPYAAVDIELYRPSTLLGWPFDEGPYEGTGWLVIGASESRRQSYPAYQFADELGYYYAEFMFPRDNVWYPCGYPYRWACNFSHPDEGYVEFHSPVAQGRLGLGGYFESPLLWPYYDSLYYDATGDFEEAWNRANPMDTVHPLWVDVYVDGDLFYSWPNEVTGYYWKVSDLEYDMEDAFDFVFVPVP